jgi:apoptosis-inducing factor 2
MYSDKQNVVVLGGGAAGFDIVRKLSAKLDPTRHNLILVNNRTFHVWLPALVRAIVSHHGHLEDLDNGALIPYGKHIGINT